MPELGRLALGIAFLLAIYSIGANLYGARTGTPSFLSSARHALWAMCAMVTIAIVALWTALLRSDFHLEYVASYSSLSLPIYYKITSLWGGQQGSLLFWTWLLSIFTSIAAFQNRRRNPDTAPYAMMVLAGIAIFFLGMLNFVTRPFDLLSPVPLNGHDLNPLLQNYWMAIHPPSLYTGYVSASVPFAFGAAALMTGKLDDSWIRSTRRWAIFSWLFLTLGNLFGARWAYEVLGWGGYWAWDPVENAAFMPWLVMTAYLHSVMIQERKDMLKVWNLALIGLAFSLTIFGTFITRSGVISSVHSFTQSGLGPYFLGFLLFVVVGYTGLLIFRAKELRSPAEFESYLSREAAFLFNNLMLVGIAFAVFWGTIFPVLSEAVRGVKITVGPPFFNRVNAPLALGLLFLMGVGPLIAWRRTTPKNLLRSFAAPAALGVATGLALFVAGIRMWYVLAAFSLAAFRARHHRGRVPARSGGARAYGGRASRPGAGQPGRQEQSPLRRLYHPSRRADRVCGNNRLVSSSRPRSRRACRRARPFRSDRTCCGSTVLTSTETTHLDRFTARVSVFRGGKLITVMTPAKLFFRRRAAAGDSGRDSIDAVRRPLPGAGGNR